MSTTVLFLMSTMFIANVGFGVILPTLPFLSRHIGANTFEMGLALSAFAIAQLLFSSFWGGMSDRVGKRPILILGIVGYGIASALVGLSPNVPVLLLLRFLSGALASAVFPASLGLAAAWSKPEDRPRVMAYMGSMNGIGFIVGPPLGAVLSVWGLQIPFFVVGLLSVASGILAFWLLPDEPRKPIYDGQTRFPSFGFSQITASLGALFDRKIAPFLGGTFAFTTADAAITSTLAYFLTDTLHSTQAMAGWAFMVNGGVGAFIQVAMFSFLYQRWGEIATIVTGFLFGAIGFLALGLSTSVGWVFVAVTLLAFCRGFAFPAMTSAISLRTTVDSQGTSFGSQMTFNSLGRTIGPLIAGWLFAYQERFPYFFACGLLLLTIALIRMSMNNKISARA
jgi:DHA1 family multidrug resistance protein-like MFS transporter